MARRSPIFDPVNRLFGPEKQLDHLFVYPQQRNTTESQTSKEA
jgi:hypothetical protein